MASVPSTLSSDVGLTRLLSMLIHSRKLHYEQNHVVVTTLEVTRAAARYVWQVRKETEDENLAALVGLL